MAGELYDRFPQRLTPGTHYIVYLHGKIIEDAGTRPTHPVFGVYEFNEILSDFLNQGYSVIAEVRQSGTDVQEYATYVGNQLRRYRKQSDSDIAVVGFSKGAVIALTVSAQMNDPGIDYAILAGCWKSVTERDLPLSGRILSLYDVSDSVGSCQSLIERSGDVSEFDEEVFDTGKSHGLFYRPDPVWIEPLFRWLKGNVSETL